MSDFKAKCTKFDVGWGSALDPAMGAYSAPPDPLAVLKGPTSKGREGTWEGMGRGGKGREHRGREGEGGERKGREGRAPPIFYCTPSSSFLEICLGLLQYHLHE